MISPDYSVEPSVDGLRTAIETVDAQGLLVVGSLGRAAVFHNLTGNAFHEFEYRKEEPLIGASGPRDVDVLGGPVSAEVRYSTYPHTVDDKAYSNTWFAIKQVDGNWQYKRQSLHQPAVTGALDPVIFQPVQEQTIFGIPCRTVRPATHYALMSEAPRIQAARELLYEAMPKGERQLLDTPAYRKLREVLVPRARMEASNKTRVMV